MTITVACRQCGQKYTVGAEHAGKQIRCKGCGGVVPVPVPRGGGPSGSAVAPRPAAPTPVASTPAGVEQVTCPHCQGTCAIRPEWRGIQLECPTCRQRFLVPGGAGTAPGRSGSHVATSPPGGSYADARHREGAWQSAPPRDFSDADQGDAVQPRSRRRNSEFPLSLRQIQLIGGGAVAAVLLGCVIYVATKMKATAVPTGPQEPFPMDVTVPAFTERGLARVIEPGVERYEIHLGGASNQPGHGGKLWLYLPAGQTEPKSLPCVLIAPAGSPLITGMDLGDGDVPEHVPYVRAGFAVLAYELDGVVQDIERAAGSDIAIATNKFRAARAGLVNARVAIEYAVMRVPQIDPSRIYAAGHSSAATHALLFAAHEPRIKACAAFAPCVDLPQRLGTARLRMLSLTAPGISEFAARASPRAHEERIGCPVLLFHALDDTNVPVSESQQCAARLEQLGKKVSLVTVPTGDHYYSMIERGIPTAISWLTELGAQPMPPIRGQVASSRPAQRPQAASPSDPDSGTGKNNATPRKQNEADRKKSKREAELDAELDRAKRGIKESGPGWELAWPKATHDYVYTHHELGFRIHVPISWELNREAQNVNTVVSSADRQFAVALAPRHSFSSGLGAIVRVEVFAAEGDAGPADMLKKCERAVSAADRRKSNYQRVGAITEFKLESLPAARLVYTVRDQRTNGEFEIDVVRREDTMFVVTAACVNNSFERNVRIDDVRKALQSFELIPPKKTDGAAESGSDDK